MKKMLKISKTMSRMIFKLLKDPYFKEIRKKMSKLLNKALRETKIMNTPKIRCLRTLSGL